MEFLAGLEANGFAWCDGYLGTGARVAADSGFARFDGKYTEAAEFDTIACYEGLLHAVEDCVNGRLCLGSWQPGAFNNPLYKVLLNH